MKIEFQKMQSLGNDFVFINSEQFNSNFILNSELIKCICNRNYGIGCDLLVLYEKKSFNEFQVKFFNSDGSEAETCGNAIRCFRFLINKNNEIFLSSNGRQYLVSSVQEGVKVQFEKPMDIFLTSEFQDFCKEYLSDFHVKYIAAASVGNPHLIVFVEKIPTEDILLTFASDIYKKSSFENGINVSFAQILSSSIIEAKVVERGCGLTLACGSAAGAVAYIAKKNNFIGNYVIIKQLGGDLNVIINNDYSFSQIGNAKSVFFGFYELEEEMSQSLCEQKIFTIYTDGACSGNPGPGGWGAVIIDDAEGIQQEISGYEENSTNNRMELMGAIVSLEKLPQSSEINLYTDSKYLMDGITKWIKKWSLNNWQTAGKKSVKNKELWIRLLEQSERHSISWNWVKGHSGNEFNEKADTLARNAIEKSK